MENFFETRGVLYSFLSRGFLKETDEEFLDVVKNIDYSCFDDDTTMDRGFRLLKKFRESISSLTLLNLARDYARTFLGAGLAKNAGAYPYESVYTSGERLLMQESRDEVMKMYSTEELGRIDKFKEPEDHLAFELEFMAHLCRKSVEALESGSKDELKKYIDKQKEFYDKHLGVWAESFCDDVVKVSREDFYKAFALITKGFMEEEKESLAALEKMQEQVT